MRSQRRVRVRRLTAIAALLAVFSVGCVDVTPSSERDRLVLLAPPAARDGFDTVMGSYSTFATTLPPAAYYLEVSEMLRHLDEDSRVAVIATFDDQVTESVLARQQIVDRAVIAVAGLVAAGNVSAASMAALTELDVAVAVQERSAGAIGASVYDALLRYGVLSRLSGSLRPTRGVEESLDLLRAGRAGAAILLAPEAVGSGAPLLFAFDPGVDEPLSLQLLLLHERHADARPVFEHLRSDAAQATLIARGWSAPR